MTSFSFLCNISIINNNLLLCIFSNNIVSSIIPILILSCLRFAFEYKLTCSSMPTCTNLFLWVKLMKGSNKYLNMLNKLCINTLQIYYRIFSSRLPIKMKWIYFMSITYNYSIINCREEQIFLHYKETKC